MRFWTLCTSLDVALYVLIQHTRFSHWWMQLLIAFVIGIACAYWTEPSRRVKFRGISADGKLRWRGKCQAKDFPFIVDCIQEGVRK